VKNGPLFAHQCLAQRPRRHCHGLFNKYFQNGPRAQYIGISLSLFLRLSLAIPLSCYTSLFLCLSLPVPLSSCTSLFLYLSLPVPLSSCTSLFLQISLPINLSSCTSIYLYLSLPINLSLYASLFLYLPLPTNLSSYASLLLYLSLPVPLSSHTSLSSIKFATTACVVRKHPSHAWDHSHSLSSRRAWECYPPIHPLNPFNVRRISKRMDKHSLSAHRSRGCFVIAASVSYNCACMSTWASLSPLDSPFLIR